MKIYNVASSSIQNKSKNQNRNTNPTFCMDMRLTGKLAEESKLGNLHLKYQGMLRELKFFAQGIKPSDKKIYVDIDAFSGQPMISDAPKYQSHDIGLIMDRYTSKPRQLKAHFNKFKENLIDYSLKQDI